MVKEDTLYNSAVELFNLDEKEFQTYLANQNIKNSKYIYIWKDIYILKFLFDKKIAQNRIKSLLLFYLEGLNFEIEESLIFNVISNYNKGDYVERFVFSIYHEDLRVNNQIEKLKDLQEYIIFDWRKTLFDKISNDLKLRLSNYHDDIQNDFINFIFDEYLNKNTTILEFNNKLNKFYISKYLVSEFIKKNYKDESKKRKVESLDEKIYSGENSNITPLDLLEEKSTNFSDNNFIDLKSFSKIIGEMFINNSSSTNNIRKIFYLYLVLIIGMKVEKYMVSTDIKNQSIVTGVSNELKIDLFYITLTSIDDYVHIWSLDKDERENIIVLLKEYSVSFDNRNPLKYQKEMFDKLVKEKKLDNIVKKSNYEYLINACKCFLSKSFLNDIKIKFEMSEDKLQDFQEKLLPLFFSQKQPNRSKKILSDYFKINNYKLDESDISSLYTKISSIGEDLTRKNILSHYDKQDLSSYIESYIKLFSKFFDYTNDIYFQDILNKSNLFKSFLDKDKTSFIFSFFIIPILNLNLIKENNIILIKPTDNTDFSFDLNNKNNFEIFLLTFERMENELHIKDISQKT